MWTLITKKESTKLNNMEKTFEEMIVEQFCEDGLIKMSFSRNDLIEMMQQVREATIAECSYIELDGFSSVEIQRRFKEIPTDRIKTKL